MKHILRRLNNWIKSKNKKKSSKQILITGKLKTGLDR